MLGAIFIMAAAAAYGIAMSVQAYRRKNYKELVVSLIVLCAGTAMSVGMALRLSVPNPVDWINAVFQPLAAPIVGWVEGGG